MKKWLIIGLKIMVSGGLIWFLLGSIDLGSARDRIMDASPTLIIGAMALLLIQMGFGGARWYAVVRAVHTPIPWLELTRLFYIGVFFSQALPSSVGGDPIRMYMAYKDGLPLPKSINSVMLERAVAVIALVLIVAAVQPMFLPKLAPQAHMWTVSAIGMLAVGAVAGLAFLMTLDRLPERYARFKIVRGLAHLAGDTRRLFLSPGHALHAITWGVVAQVNMSTCVYVLALGLDLDISWTDCLVLMPPVMLVTTIPISIAGWGVREGAMAWAFGLVGVSVEGATVLSLTLGVVAILISVPAGILWLMGRRRGESVSAEEAQHVIEDSIEHDAEPDPKTP